MTASNKSILILDDDATFRELIASVLATRGYEVVEARSVKDASAAFATSDPGLAIVDYRLPESDGISWITWLRESGRNFPVVFCSGTWCDEKTFSWLRNILRVSLILRKPIVPELFMQQVENLLPPLPVKHPLPQVMQIATQSSSSFVQEKSQNDDLNIQIGKLTEAIETSAADSPLLQQLIDVRQKLLVQVKLNEAKSAYIEQLEIEWDKLSTAVSKTQSNFADGTLLEEAINLSHRIRGTAGSMGYTKVGEAAGRVEDLLRRFDPDDTLQEILWTEIFRAMADGETSVREHAALRASKGETIENITASVFLFGTESQYAAHRKLLAESGVELVTADSIAAAAGRIRRAKFDAAILDLNAERPERLFQFASQIRQSQGNKPIPMAFISRGQEAPDEASVAYAGGSALLWHPVHPDDMNAIVRRLLRSSDEQKSRVLTVDDDEVLTRFIGTILGAENMTVQPLNKPIQILNAVEDFQPDLILLDVMMPGLSGYDVCRMLRSTEKWKNIPIVFLTSKSDAEGRAAAFAAGGNDFLSKPVLAPELIARVRAQLDQAGYKKGSAERDDSTGMMSRREFIPAATACLQECVRTQSEMALCLLSVDDLINISVVHSLFSAEQAVNALSDLLSTHFKSEAIRAKWGEGSFALVVPGENKLTMTEAIQKMLIDFADLKFPSESVESFKTTFSAGLAGLPGDEGSLESLINLANLRMIKGRQEKLGAIAAG